MAAKRPKLDEWIEEERRVPSTEYEVEFDDQGNPVRVTPHEVEKVVTEKVIYASMTPHKLCSPDQHYFEIRNGGKRVAGRLEVQCRHCGLGKNFVLGVHRLVDGRIETRVGQA